MTRSITQLLAMPRRLHIGTAQHLVSSSRRLSSTTSASALPRTTTTPGMPSPPNPSTSISAAPKNTPDPSPLSMLAQSAHLASQQPLPISISLPEKDPLLESLVNNLMKDGKKATARRLVEECLKYILLTMSTAQSASATANSIASNPNATVNPRLVLGSAVDAVMPLFKVRGVKRGGKSLMTPVPLTEKQRRRTAIKWIIEAAQGRNKRDSMGVRLGKEILSIIEGESAVLVKRLQIHKTALLNRSNVVLVDRQVRSG